MCGGVVTFRYCACYGAHPMSPMERQKQDRIDAAFGEWVRMRLAAQKPDRWTQLRLRDELAQRGHEVTREWVNQVIGGEHASDDLRKAIESLLGEFPQPAGAEPTSAELAAAIREQAAAITALTKELRLARLGQIEETAQVLEAIAAVVGAPKPPRTRGAAGHGAGAGTPR